MKSNHKNTYHEGSSRDPSNRRSYDDMNALDPDPDNDLQFLEEDEDEISDYSRMELEQDWADKMF
jgi:hypothetical protein